MHLQSRLDVVYLDKEICVDDCLSLIRSGSLFKIT